MGSGNFGIHCNGREYGGLGQPGQAHALPDSSVHT